MTLTTQEIHVSATLSSRDLFRMAQAAEFENRPADALALRVVMRRMDEVAEATELGLRVVGGTEA